MDFLFKPVRHFHRVKALERHLRRIRATSTRAVGFKLLIADADQQASG